MSNFSIIESCMESGELPKPKSVSEKESLGTGVCGSSIERVDNRISMKDIVDESMLESDSKTNAFSVCKQSSKNSAESLEKVVVDYAEQIRRLIISLEIPDLSLDTAFSSSFFNISGPVSIETIATPHSSFIDSFDKHNISMELLPTYITFNTTLDAKESSELVIYDDNVNCSGLEPKMLKISPKEKDFSNAKHYFEQLENMVSTPQESSINRSSLYAKFDPLYLKCETELLGRDNVLPASVPDSTSPEILKDVSHKYLDNTRELVGNGLMCFETPKPKSHNRSADISNSDLDQATGKVYTEKDLQHHLKLLELTIEGAHLKKRREMEQQWLKEEADKIKASEKETITARALKVVVEELLELLMKAIAEKNKAKEAVETLLVEHKKTTDELTKTYDSIQTTEKSFADFNIRYEKLKIMLKIFKENEKYLKSEIADCQGMMKGHEMFQLLNDHGGDNLNKTNTMLSISNNSAELVNRCPSELEILQVQLAISEMKIQSQQSSIDHIQKENAILKQLSEEMDKIGAS